MTKNATKTNVPNKKDFTGLEEIIPKRKVAAEKNGELWCDRTPESLKTIQHLFELSPIDKLKYEWFIELAHLYRMLDLENKVGVILPGIHAQLCKLLKLIEPLIEAEFATPAKNDQERSGSEAASKKAPTDSGHVELTPNEAKAVEDVDAFFVKISGGDLDSNNNII
jgi:hypothetical protein